MLIQKTKPAINSANLRILFMQNLKGLTSKELANFFTEIKEPKYRSKQIAQWIYVRGVNDFEKMTDFSKSLRQKLKDMAYISTLPIIKKQVSNIDATTKYLFETKDKQLIESVLIPESPRNTICISSQAGCKLHCSFCLSGDGNFKRNLDTSEIIDQIMTVQQDIGQDNRISNVVFMGMGEPLLNYNNVVKAIQIIKANYGLAIGARKITVSTAGIAPEIYKLANEKLNNRLAISLNAATDKKRSEIMPINDKYPLKELMKAASAYAKTASRKITLEYVMIKDFNDTLKDAYELIKLIKDLSCKINLIPYNENPFKPYQQPAENTLKMFIDILTPHCFSVTTRHSKGKDILAACGQLRGQYK